MPAAFATPDDVAARWRPLTDAETAVAATLVGDASTLIRQRFPGIDAQVTSGAVSADVLMIVVAGMVRRALIAPDDGVSQESATIGPHSATQTYANPMRNIFLTDADLTLILGYQQTAVSSRFSNTTDQCGPNAGFVYMTGP